VLLFMQNYIFGRAYQTLNRRQLGLLILYFQWLITDKMPGRHVTVIQFAFAYDDAVLCCMEHNCFFFMKKNTFCVTCFAQCVPYLTVKVNNVVRCCCLGDQFVMLWEHDYTTIGILVLV